MCAWILPSTAPRPNRLAIAHPFTDRELARIVRDCYHYAINHRGIRRVLDWHRLSPEALQSR
jgi:hypothetical protein